MDIKITLLLFIAFGMTLARRRRVVQEQTPNTLVIIQNFIAPESDVRNARIMECVSTYPTIPMTTPIPLTTPMSVPCPMPVTTPMSVTCPMPVTSPISVTTPIQRREELILPPQIAELPCGLGYFPSALPLVSKCFQSELTCQEAVMPVTNMCSCMSLATPMFADYECLARPIIL